MFAVPDELSRHYEDGLKKRNIPRTLHSEYRKWLRYFLDFCTKYPVPESKAERVRLFREKLREKKQTEKQQEQAVHAIF